MQPTYAQLELLVAEAEQPDRLADMPFVGFLSGVSLAGALWTVIAWAVWAIVG